jgi:multidrug efflux pump subunit AcrA (membrane-fusion protein)
MSPIRSSGIAALLVAAGLTVAGCGGSAGAADEALAEVSTVSTPDDGSPAVVTLVEAAAKRLDIETTAVTDGPDGLTVPYSAVVYEPDGSTWVYIQAEALTYQRAAITIDAIDGDEVTVTDGPPAGTEVVSQGAAELVGVETGIDGEE